MKKRSAGVEGQVTATVAVGSFLAALIFLSPNLTGGAVAWMPRVDSNFSGMLFFLIGLVGAWFYLRTK